MDIGCFDGKLIGELDNKIKNSEFWGFDTNKHLKKKFPQGKNFVFVEDNLEELPKGFDLIILSHSIMYFAELQDLLEKINNLLNEYGYLFIQISNLSKNPLNILLGDQVFTFTPESLTNVLFLFGFIAISIDNQSFPKEDILIFQKKNVKKKPLTPESHPLNLCIEKIQRLINSINSLKGKSSTVLGTTLNAAFVDEIMKESVLYFLDENPKWGNNRFREKEVIHPKEELNSLQVIIPYGEQNDKIFERIKIPPFNRYELI